MIIISDTNLSGTKIVSTYIEDLEFRDKYKTKLDEKTISTQKITKIESGSIRKIALELIWNENNIEDTRLLKIYDTMVLIKELPISTGLILY